MKLAKVIAIAMILAMALIVSSVSAGNGIDDVNGKHFNLNLVGISKENRNMPDDLDNGHTIFVKYNKVGDTTTRIYLREGDFQVLDKDGTDGVARFQLPNPYPDYNSETGELGDPEYRVYARALGKPGGSAKITSGLCNTTDFVICDNTGIWFSADNVTLNSHGNNNKFVEVTDELTTVDLSEYTICGDGTEQCGTVPIFSDNPFGYEGDYLYFWELVNSGVKLIQLRFYEV